MRDRPWQARRRPCPWAVDAGSPGRGDAGPVVPAAPSGGL